MLDKSILDQVASVFASLKGQFVLQAFCARDNERRQEMREFLDDFASTSSHLSVEFNDAEGEAYSFALLKDGADTGIKFSGLPNGHEFTSLLLAVLNADGQGKNLPDEQIVRRIKGLKEPVKLQTYVSLTCTNCPDVVQALNVMSLINPNISHEMIDGGVFQDDITRLNIQGVPAVYANGESLHVGRGDLGVLLQELEDKVGSSLDDEAEAVERRYDVVVLGGGPAGSSAAIYSARKGLKVAIVAERIGGQVKDTVGIENLISVPQTTGAKLADDLKSHLGDYPIDIFENRKITAVSLKGGEKSVSVKGGETFLAPAVIIATGASWRKLNVDDEAKYVGHGVHFCPHCDGPFYKGKKVAVIGGGNSGVEAAIDLAGICSHVTLLEFGEAMRADDVLQQKAQSMPNIDIRTLAQTTRVKGDGTKVTAITVKDRSTDEEADLALDGVFVQIGLMPSTDVFKAELPLTPRGEIEIDAFGRTAVPGVYAAGDCSTVPYKQIVIAMGEGAKAALSAFDDKIRGVIG